jgi:transcriptional regulator with XRE-family HTH domain
LDRDREPSSAPTWREIIRSERRRVGLTQRELGRRAGIDGETIRKYENGTRVAPRENLDRIFEVLQSSEGTMHRALLDRGFFHPNTRFPIDREPGYYYALEELPAFIDQVRWPVFCVNELGEIVAANRAVQALWGIDFAAEVRRRGRARANLLVAMCEPRFASRLVNWDEILRLFIAADKAVPASRTMLENPGVLFEEIVGAIGSANPAALRRIEDLWATTPPARPKVRWLYPVVWREPGFGDLHFQGIVNAASEPEGIGFNDWVPIDAATWTALDTILARRDGGG